MGKLYYMELDDMGFSFYTKQGYCVSSIYDKTLGANFGYILNKQISSLLYRSD